MRTLAIIGAALCGLALSTSVQARDYLPKKFWGSWCVTESATGGGSPRFWVYSRSKVGCDGPTSGSLAVGGYDLERQPHG